MTGRGGGGPRSDLKFTTPSECKMFSGGLRSPSRITHQLGKYDLEPKSVFPDATGSHPVLPPLVINGRNSEAEPIERISAAEVEHGYRSQ